MDLKQSRDILTAAFSIEENYDLLLGNYLELEKSAMSLAADGMIRLHREYYEMFEVTAEMNRRAVNLLSSARLFIDQLSQRFKTCGGDRGELKKFPSNEYDNFFEYRFMEELRNHVQHSGSAVHGLSMGGEWRPRHKKEVQFFCLEAHTFRRFLSLDKSFKSKILQECPEKIDFLSAVRTYIAALSRIHQFAGAGIEEQVEKSRYSFESAIEKYSNFTGTSAIALAAHSSQSPSPSDPINILLEWDNVRRKLIKRNRNLKNLNVSVISNTLPQLY